LAKKRGRLVVLRNGLLVASTGLALCKQMEIARFISTSCLLCLFFNEPAQAKGPAHFNLTLDALVPKAGIETEITFNSYAMLCRTNEVGGQPLAITNLNSLLNLKLKNKCLVWDETNGYAKIEIVVDHCFSTQKDQTDEVVKPGTRINGTFIAGEWFFEPATGYLSGKTPGALNKIFSAHPNTGNKDYDFLELNHPRSVGETWKIKPRELIKRGLQELDDSTGRLPQLISILDTNHMKNTVQFTCLTNVAGFNCFELRQQSKIRGEFHGLIYSDEHKLDFAAPVDGTFKYYMLTAVASCFTSHGIINGTNKVRVQSRDSIKMTIECRQVATSGP
jgi:hypothetical protein